MKYPKYNDYQNKAIKITPEIEKEMREMRRSGKTLKYIASCFNVSPTAVSYRVNDENKRKTKERAAKRLQMIKNTEEYKEKKKERQIRYRKRKKRIQKEFSEYCNYASKKYYKALKEDREILYKIYDNQLNNK